MAIASLIQLKRDGGALTPAEWRAIIADYVAGRLPDYQMAALLMAIMFRGLSPEELGALTDAMVASGDRLRLDDLDRPVVDKHSTGGVGDKVSLIVAPLVASCGVAVPKMSGRGLGHTGGTLDKLESIPGFRTALGLREAEAQLRRLGCAMFGQTAELTPADRKLYALRHVTATVESIPLIAASIMSKKLAEDLDGLVLDVKTGPGAFLPDLDRALELATVMIALGETRGCRTIALVTAMDRPLGRACGHSLEVEEALQVLGGQGPEDLREVALALGAEMLLVGGIARDAAEARGTLEQALASGAALRLFGDVIEAQGGVRAVIEDPGLLPQANKVEVFRAPAGGSIAAVNPRTIGEAIKRMGGGRLTMDDVIDPSVGFVITVKPGDKVQPGQPIASIFARDAAGVEIGTDALTRAIEIGPAPAPLPLVSHRVTAQGVEILG
ncbi:MAG TPA: thymidine phosphorylase [Gemmatimonadales bacterium]|nr:thymidine phosphorylase [Gemmatimonadales bacterium]